MNKPFQLIDASQSGSEDDGTWRNVLGVGPFIGRVADAPSIGYEQHIGGRDRTNESGVVTRLAWYDLVLDVGHRGCDSQLLTAPVVEEERRLVMDQ